VRYRKWGRVVRWENGVVVRVEEAGEATEGEVFEARPIVVTPSGSEGPGWAGGAINEPFGAAPPPRPLADARGDSIDLPLEILRSAQDDRQIERLVVIEGIAVHDCDGIRWTDRTRRLHASLARAPLRATVDLADFDFDLLRRIDLRDVEDAHFDRVHVAPHVFASFLPSLDIDREQMPAERDGRGNHVERRRVAGDPPNVFRPSYRIPPIAAWLNVRAIPFGDIDRDLPEAIARLDDGLLVVHGDRRYRVPLRDFVVDAVGESERWYPYAAGAFGAEACFRIAGPR